jgi:enoyl-CoA hydratase/carnithine racemase
LNIDARPPRVVIVEGEDGNFVSGGDIEEFPSFRFEPGSLRAFHEDTVAPALQAMLDCDIPLLAQIEGPCIGGGLEIASCCDIRICGRASRFGVPIARLGFPMAPFEAEVVARTLPPALLRELLIEARLLTAPEALRHGIVQRVMDDGQVAAEVQASAERIAALSPQALRLNKRLLRQMAAGPLTTEQRALYFDYADSAEHREGLAAFLEKRPARF